MASKKTGDSCVDTEPAPSKRGKRGKIILTGLAKRKAKGKRSVVSFNEWGQPVGDENSEMQSYIGILARTEVKISYKSWRHVPKREKELIWEHVNLAYDVPGSWKIGCIQSANIKWRQWKNRLYKEFIEPYTDEPEKLAQPPPLERISPEDWRLFVISRMSSDFKKLSEEQSKRAKMNEYPHSLSRKGYPGLAEDMKPQLTGNKGADRMIMWRQARSQSAAAKDNNKLKDVFEKIDDCLQESEDGQLDCEEWGDDLLSRALGKPEHYGRIRGVGSYVSPSMYFKLPAKGGSLSKGKEKDLLDAKKQISQQNEMISLLNERIMKLEAAIKTDHLTEEKGSCSVKRSYRDIDEDFEFNDKDEEPEQNQKDEEMIVMQKVDTLLVSPEFNGSSPDHIVPPAEKKSANEQPLHDEKLKHNEKDEEMIDEKDEDMIVLPKVSTTDQHVSSPDIVPANKIAKKAILAKNVKKDIVPAAQRRRANQKPLNKRNPKLYNALSSYLKVLYVHLEDLHKKEMGMKITFEKGVFGNESPGFVHLLEDMDPFCELKDISANCIVWYVWCLYKKLKSADDGNTLKRILFVNPFSISKTKLTPKSKRTIALSERMKDVSANQLVMVPANVGGHWILTIIDPDVFKVYVLDPASRGQTYNNEDWKDVVNTALSVFDLSKRNASDNWELVKCPRQPDGHQCGFYVMHYMRDIVEELMNGPGISIHELFKNKNYSSKDINEVRDEWAKCVLDNV